MSQSKPIQIVQLYPRDLNIYGDWGNALTVQRRLQWRGFSPEIIDYNRGDDFPEQVDIIIGGGGQDSGQEKVYDDLLRLSERLHGLVAGGTPTLVICGTYQLLGKRFLTHTGAEIPGIGILDLETIGGDTRLVGNVVADSPEFGSIVGYENHSGITTLGPGVAPLSTVRQGAGNNGKDGTEGARFENLVGSYLHGSLLPKNPRIADFLIECAVERRYGEQLEPLDDTLANRAHATAEQLAL